MSNSRDERYNNISKFRRSPPDISSFNGGYVSSQGKDVILPSLTTAFPIISYSGQQNAYNSRSSLSRNEATSFAHMNWPMNNHAMAGNQPYNYAPHEHDSRLSAQSPYPVHTSRQSPSERLPPLSIPQHHREDRWQNSQFNSNQYHTTSPMHVVSPSSNIRSPLAAYPPHDSYYDHAEHYHPNLSSAVDARHLHPLNTFSQDNYLSQGIIDHSGWSPSITRTDTHGISPYSRHPPDTLSTGRSPSADSPVDFSTVKKKRKRADASQLKILNEVFDRTAFPTTEERQELAKKLDMTPRSVQIWFQNKRQATRQSRIPSHPIPSIVHHPYPSPQSVVGASERRPNHGSSGVGEVVVSPTTQGSSFAGRQSMDGSNIRLQAHQLEAYRRTHSPEDGARMRSSHPRGPSY